MEHAIIWTRAGGGSVGQSVLHEIIESYFGGVNFPGKSVKDIGNNQNFIRSHDMTIALENPKLFYPEIQYHQDMFGYFTHASLINKTGKEFLLYNK